jgi:hypothetical protein
MKYSDECDYEKVKLPGYAALFKIFEGVQKINQVYTFISN